MKSNKATETTAKNKERMIEALRKSLGVVSHAIEIVGLDRSTHYRWMNEDPEYKAAVEALDDVALDFAETQLFKQMKEGSTAATIFYLKTRGKKRGYVERTEITGAEGEPIKTQVSFNFDKLSIEQLNELERLAQLARDSEGSSEKEL